MNWEICRNTCDIPRSETTIQIWIVRRSVVLIMVAKVELNVADARPFGFYPQRNGRTMAELSKWHLQHSNYWVTYFLLHLVFILLVLTMGPTKMKKFSDLKSFTFRKFHVIRISNISNRIILPKPYKGIEIF